MLVTCREEIQHLCRALRVAVGLNQAGIQEGLGSIVADPRGRIGRGQLRRPVNVAQLNRVIAVRRRRHVEGVLVPDRVVLRHARLRAVCPVLLHERRVPEVQEDLVSGVRDHHVPMGQNVARRAQELVATGHRASGFFFEHVQIDVTQDPVLGHGDERVDHRVGEHVAVHLGVISDVCDQFVVCHQLTTIVTRPI